MTRELTIFLQCPHCEKFDRSIVVDSRRHMSTNRIKRRRECTSCHGRYTTFESIEINSFKLVRFRKQTIKQIVQLLRRLEY